MTSKPGSARVDFPNRQLREVNQHAGHGIGPARHVATVSLRFEDIRSSCSCLGRGRDLTQGIEPQFLAIPEVC